MLFMFYTFDDLCMFDQLILEGIEAKVTSNVPDAKHM